MEVGHREDEGGGIGAEGLELGGRRYQARARSSLARTTSARTPTFSAAAIHLSGNALHQPELAQVIDAQVRFHLHAMRVGPEGDYLTRSFTTQGGPHHGASVSGEVSPAGADPGLDSERLVGRARFRIDALDGRLPASKQLAPLPHQAASHPTSAAGRRRSTAGMVAS